MDSGGGASRARILRQKCRFAMASPTGIEPDKSGSPAQRRVWQGGLGSVPMTTAQKVERLKLIVDRIAADADRALMTYHMMLRLNGDKQLRDLFEDAGGLSGLNIVYVALLHGTCSPEM